MKTSLPLSATAVIEPFPVPRFPFRQTTFTQRPFPDTQRPPKLLLLQPPHSKTYLLFRHALQSKSDNDRWEQAVFILLGFSGLMAVLVSFVF